MVIGGMDMDLYLVEDENYRFVVKANNWREAKEKACTWYQKKYGRKLDIEQLEVSICDNEDIIE